MTIEHNRVYLPEGQPRAVLLLLQCLHQPQGGAPHRHTSENIATITCSLVETRSTSSDTHRQTHSHTHTHTHTHTNTHTHTYTHTQHTHPRLPHPHGRATIFICYIS